MGTRIDLKRQSYARVFHLKTLIRDSIVVNIGQFISTSFPLYKVYVIKKSVVAIFFGNTTSSN